ncbi:MAG: peptide ABC transporter substrate-binding protein [Clostridia bacterium]|nr:peptide ABC transporter substrate-binding protein [Clostridia bacterium]
MNRKKLISLALAGALGLGLLAGCASKPAATTPAPGSSAPVATPAATGKNINVIFASEPQTIDPALNSSVDGAIMTQHMFEGLMKWGDSGRAVEGTTMNQAEIVNGQAKDHTKTVNDDGTVTYVFTLRDDIKWSDGQAVTAGDFEYSWKRLVTPATAADYSNMASMIKGYDEVIAATADPSTLAVKAIDEKTLEVVLSYDCPYFLEVCAFPALLPVRQDKVEGNDQWTFNTDTYIGNGAYKMKEWEHNGKIVMEKNDQYYDYAKLGPDTITFTLSDDDNAMLAGYRSGEVDYIQDVPVDEIAGLLASGELNIVDYVGTYYVCYQNQKAPFDDWRVRKAFTLAIDSKYIVEQVTQTGQIPATGWVPSGMSDAESGSDFRATGGDIWSAPLDDATYKANLEEANKLLDEAGYTDRTKFPPIEYLYNTSDAHKAVGEALQSQWQSGLGVQVTLKNQEWGTFLETRKQGDYQIARNGWINDYNDPMGFLDMWVTGGGNNDAQYANPDYDAAIKAAQSTSDPVERMKYMHEAENLLMSQDWALGPIYFYTQKYMMKDDIKGVYYTPLGYFFFQYATR